MAEFISNLGIQPGHPPNGKSSGGLSSEADWMRTLCKLAERYGSQSVEESGCAVNQLTKVSEFIPGLVNQLTTLVNQNEVVNQSPVIFQTSPKKQPQSRPQKDEKKFKSRKERRLKGIRLSAEKLQKYELWCFINKTDFQDAVEKAMDWLTSGQPVNRVLIDDQDDDGDTCKSTSSSAIGQIVDFYRHWTGNAVGEEDHRAMEEIADLDLNTIKLGILTAICRKASSRQATRKIHSFRYFLAPIREVARSRIGRNVTENALQSTVRFLLETRQEVPDSSERRQS